MPERGRALDLARYRLDRAKECLDTARSNYESGDLRASANRSYYCIFHCMRAALATRLLDSKKHSGVIAMFRREFIKTGELPERLSPMIGEAFDIRSASDYDDFYIASREDILRQISNAAEFMNITENYLSTKADDPCQ